MQTVRMLNLLTVFFEGRDMANTFKVNDEVLPAGLQKPLMRVVEVSGDNVTCSWIDPETGKSRSETYRYSLVQKKPRGGGPPIRAINLPK